MLILASKSPARSMLLQQAGVAFQTQPSAIDERKIEHDLQGKIESPDQLATKLASAKALQVSGQNQAALVIGADQTLLFEGENFHKPNNMEEAKNQLRGFRGKVHQLISSTVLARAGEILWCHSATANLKMRDFTEVELDHIVALEGEELLWSVGAYRFEGPSIQLFEEIDGDYFTILGMPLLPLLAALRTFAPDSFSSNHDLSNDT